MLIDDDWVQRNWGRRRCCRLLLLLLLLFVGRGPVTISESGCELLEVVVLRVQRDVRVLEQLVLELYAFRDIVLLRRGVGRMLLLLLLLESRGTVRSLNRRGGGAELVAIIACRRLVMRLRMAEPFALFGGGELLLLSLALRMGLGLLLFFFFLLIFLLIVILLLLIFFIILFFVIVVVIAFVVVFILLYRLISLLFVFVFTAGITCMAFAEIVSETRIRTGSGCLMLLLYFHSSRSSLHLIRCVFHLTITASVVLLLLLKLRCWHEGESKCLRVEGESVLVHSAKEVGRQQRRHCNLSGWGCICGGSSIVASLGPQSLRLRVDDLTRQALPRQSPLFQLFQHS